MEERVYILWLSKINGIGLRKQKALIDYFGSGKSVFYANEYSLKISNILTQNNIIQILNKKNEQKLIDNIQELIKKEIKFTSLADDDYPPNLREIVDPPSIIYYKGTLPTCSQHSVSIIGARRCSTYGKNVAYKLASDLAKNDINVVSGMARGTDTIAHKGAIESNGRTIAVLGCGVDICYPPENKLIMEKISETGCIMSELAPGTTPLPGFFPMRNRIISGLSEITVVIEASKKSGTLITANFALSQGREVFAVPGNITSSLSEGTNNLIKDGAFPLTSYEDILNYLEIDIRDDKVDNSRQISIIQNLTENEKLIYKFIGVEPITVDEIVLKCNNQVSVVQYVLTMLEIKGAIQKLPGQKFIRSY